MTEIEKINQQHEEDLQRLRDFRLLDDDFMSKQCPQLKESGKFPQAD